MGIGVPLIPDSLEVFLGRVVNEADDTTCFVECDKASGSLNDEIYIWKIIFVEVVFLLINCDGVSQFLCLERPLCIGDSGQDVTS